MRKIDDLERMPISSLKQFIYCQRRYALMYTDCEWGSNYKIVEGDILHEKVDDPFFNEKRGDVHISRSVPIYSEQLNLYGVIDIIEFIKDDCGVKITGKNGLWRINPIEYKNGKPENSHADNYQLCAQAICLEEMFHTKIDSGDIFYGKIKRRVKVEFSDELRRSVTEQIDNMVKLLNSHKIPKMPENQNCSLCSLADICMPQISESQKPFAHQIFRSVKGERG